MVAVGVADRRRVRRARRTGVHRRLVALAVHRNGRERDAHGAVSVQGHRAVGRGLGGAGAAPAAELVAGAGARAQGNPGAVRHGLRAVAAAIDHRRLADLADHLAVRRRRHRQLAGRYELRANRAVRGQRHRAVRRAGTGAGPAVEEVGPCRRWPSASQPCRSRGLPSSPVRFPAPQSITVALASPLPVVPAMAPFAGAATVSFGSASTMRTVVPVTVIAPPSLAAASHRDRLRALPG